MRFKDFLIETTIESKPILQDTTREEMVKWIKANASQYMKHMNKRAVIVRGGYKGPDFAIGDSSKFKRKSANTQNYTNLFVDSSKNWSSYPSRASAYICSNSFETAETFSGDSGYDNFYMVIPADNAHLGICPSGDFWYSFETVLIRERLHVEGFSSVSGLNEWLMENFKLSETDPTELRSQLKKINIPYLMKNLKSNFRLTIVNTMHKYGLKNLCELLELLLDPEANGFTETTGGNFKRVDDSREIWVSGKAAFIQTTRKDIYDLIDQLKKEIE